MAEPRSLRPSFPAETVRAIASVAVGTLFQAAAVQSWLSSEATAATFFTRASWRALVVALGGNVASSPGGQALAEVPFSSVLIPVAAVSLLAWLAGGAALARLRRLSFGRALAAWGAWGWLWWSAVFLWEILWLGAFAVGSEGAVTLLTGVPSLWQSLCMAGWLATFFALAFPFESQGGDRFPRTVLAAIVTYVVVFTAMNWLLYWGLWLPHGDSAMYEEHLWNLTHGKGFRSNLDPGSFLGEHIQVIHVLLVPLHVLWPSQLLLELCESSALAVGALPVFWITLRHTGSRRAGTLLAVAYLLYVPLQFLDISIDLKTFRPTSLAVPCLLFAIDALERRRFLLCGLLLAVTLSAKEDYALILAPLGVWLFVSAWREQRIARTGGGAEDANQDRATMVFGGALAVAAAAYLVLALFVLIPHFRAGHEAHYVSYFSRLGETPQEILKTVLTRPGYVASLLVTAESFAYLLLLLAPLAFVPLLSPTRLAVAAPLFGILCLNEVVQTPFHHFHAPLVPIVFWAAGAGLGTLLRRRSSTVTQTRRAAPDASSFAVQATWCAALATSVFFSLGPLGIAFWDVNSRLYWKELYIPGKRAEMFAKIEGMIPQDARVASTDFVHPRFTHHAESYDYSQYRRKVSGYELRVPEDTDYIVIDTQHPYSEITSPEQVREYREHPEQWELLPDETEGYFIVLKRKGRP